MTNDEPDVGWAIRYENPVNGRDKQVGHTCEIPLMSLELLVRAIKSRTPISFEHNKAGKTPGLRIGNAHAAFIMQRKDGTESTKVDIVQTAGVSDTYPPVFPEWRMFDLTEISNIVLREQEAPFSIDPGYKADSHRYEFAIGSGLSLVSNRLSEDDINTILGRKDALEVFSHMLENSGSYTEPNWQVRLSCTDEICGTSKLSSTTSYLIEPGSSLRVKPLEGVSGPELERDVVSNHAVSNHALANAGATYPSDQPG